MKNILILLLIGSLFSCNDAKYRKLDKVILYDKEITIIEVNEFKGNGGLF